MKIKKLIFLFPLLFVSHLALAEGRYFLEGDGTVRIAGNSFAYREKDGNYSLKTFDRINEVFGLKTAPDEFIAPRLIAVMDYIQDQLKGGTIRIRSGYRSPNYNDGLRKKGKLAAKTSMHIEGMAADIEIDGVEAKSLWEYVRGLNCCGAGYYHGKGIHIDVGPARFWDETSTKVDQDIGGHNKLVLLRTNFDYYDPGETVYMTLGRITDYPIGIRPKVALLTEGGKEIESIPIDLKDLKENKNCVAIPNRRSARSIELDLPEKIDSRERLVVRMEFCDKLFPEMLDRTDSNVIEIR